MSPVATSLLRLGRLTAPEPSPTGSISMLGLALGATLVRGGRVVRAMMVRRNEHRFGAGSRPAAVIDAIVAAASALEAAPKVAGLAIPGELDGSGRCWGMPELPGFDGVYIAEELAARLGCPVSIESEGPSAAWGERLHGRGRGHSSLLSVVVGPRLSAGLLLEGELRRGRSGFGGTIAHLCIDPLETARACSCGRRGCLDTYASLNALARDYVELGGKPENPHAVAKLALSGDATALQALKRIGSALGAGLAQVQNLLDLDAITLITHDPALFPLLEPPVREALRGRVFGLPAAEVPLFEGLLGSDVVLVGAAELALRGMSESA